jgi:hypothetical protein
MLTWVRPHANVGDFHLFSNVFHLKILLQYE